MSALEDVTYLITVVNYLFNFLFLWGGLAVILLFPFYYFINSLQKAARNKPKDAPTNQTFELVFQALILLGVFLFFGFVWIFPEFIAFIKPQWFSWFSLDLATGARLILVLSGWLALVYLLGHECGEKRWLTSWAGHAALIFCCWLLDGWMGIFLLGLPILVAYYSALYRLALVILPTANPEDRQERWKRFTVFAAYTWGLQFPLYVVESHAWAKPDKRINGDFTWDYPVPGLIWAKAHQVVGITSGTKFKRVVGPGLVFTGQLERAEQIFDLRLQLRSNVIDVVTKDGISLKVVVFTAFRLDPEDWSKELHQTLRRTNPLLREARFPSYKLGSFPYSPERVQAALSVTSTKTGGATDTTIYWDQWALNVVEDQARKVVAQKKLDELWRLPDEDDTEFSNAMDVIANEIKAQVSPILRAYGILLVVSRIVNFSFPVDEIPRQQIANWSSAWEKKRSAILAEARAEADRAQQEARAYAAKLMLNAIAEGLQMAKALNQKLPRHVIALLFLSSLQDYIEQQPEDPVMEAQHHLINKLKEQITDHQGKKP